MKKILFVALAMMMAIGGRAESETRNVGEFSGVTLIGSYTVICTQGKDCNVVVEASKEVAEKLLTDVEGGILRISTKKIAGVNVISEKDTNKITVRVTLPKLQRVALVGSGDIIVEDKMAHDDNLNVSLNGSGNIEMDDVEVKFANFSLAGSGDIKIGSVKGKQVNMQLSGGGDMEAKNVESDGVRISLAGSGDMRFDEVKALNVALNSAGSGDIEMKKMDCTQLSVNQVSSGNITISNMKAITVNVNKVGSGDVKIAGKADFYNEVKHGSGKVDKSGLKYLQNNGSWNTLGTTSPNGIEAQP